LLIGITKYQLLDIVPIAYQNVFKNMNDSFIVLSRLNQIVEINPAMEKTLGLESSKVCGKKLEQISDMWPELNKEYLNLSSKNHTNKTNLVKGTKIFEMDLSNIYDSNNFFIGYLIALHDITNRK